MVRKAAPHDAYTRTRARYRAHRRLKGRARRPSLKRAVGWGLMLLSVTVLAGCLDPAEAEEDCQGEMVALAQQDGSVRLEWEPMGENITYSVHRKTDGGDYDTIAFTNGTTFTDTGTEAGTTYTYFVQDGDGACAVAEVTAVPFFGIVTGILVGMALIGGYAFMRRD